MVRQSEYAIDSLTSVGVEVIRRTGLHQKLALIDRKIAWEGRILISFHTLQEQLVSICADLAVGNCRLPLFVREDRRQTLLRTRRELKSLLGIEVRFLCKSCVPHATSL